MTDARGARPHLGRLHVITDEVLQSRFSHAEVARLVIAGGADAIQYREKRPLLTRELVAAAQGVSDACRVAGITSIVDDRADVAMAVAANGVHIGSNDISTTVARRLLGEAFLIGGTANSLAEAKRVWTTPIDYIGVGPIFGTNSKANPAPVMGLDTLARICSESPVPVIAIGNITPERVRAVMEAGAYGVAVLSGITCAPDPRAAAAEYARYLRAALDQIEASR
jgi:thiamine-phosphate pyrophosphorylase